MAAPEDIAAYELQSTHPLHKTSKVRGGGGGAWIQGGTSGARHAWRVGTTPPLHACHAPYLHQCPCVSGERRSDSQVSRAPPPPPPTLQGGILALDLSPAGESVVATAGADASVQLYDRGAERVLATLSGHTKKVYGECGAA